VGQTGDVSTSAESPVVVGILFPPEWLGEGAAAAIASLEELDPRVRVICETYVESHDLRSARGTPGAGATHDAALRAEAPELTDAHRAAFEQVHVVLALDLPFDVAEVAPNLRWVQAVGAGTAQLQSAGLGPAGIRLSSAAGVNAVGIAEFALGRVLEHWKRFRDFDEAQARHHWEPAYGRQLAGSTLGLIGLGEINSAIAVRAQAFDVRVLATRRSATSGATAPNVDELYAPPDLFTMLAQCDAVIAAVPETPETTGTMSTAAFDAMPTGAFFCNVGRGSFVDEDALVAALASGRLGGAALDVASVEPLPSDHPLWDAPNLLLSPHSAASPGAMFVNLIQLFRENLRRYLADAPLRNEVDLQRGY
jgi:phosphoglycerate dehydrogenase-like enzyme